jgi:signal transduction histidine kinase
MDSSTSQPVADARWRAAGLSAIALAMGTGLGLLLEGGAPFAIVSGLASLGGAWTVWLVRRNRDLACRNDALSRIGTEAWAVATMAQEELQQAHSRYEEIVEDLKASRDEAIAANHARAMFVAGMSHELRTPLNAVIGFSEVLELELFGSLGSVRNREYVRDIRESGQHLLSMINDILDMAKIDAGKMELHESTIELAHVINGCCRIMRTRAEDARVELTMEVPEDRPLYVQADEVRLKQIMFNLLSNAIKFTRAGGRIVVSARETDSGEVAITVQDTGIGIRAEHVALAFEPFRQVDDSLTRQVGGTGLGLPLCKALVEMHGGRLKLVSQEGEGTAVTVTLPTLVAEWTSSVIGMSGPPGDGPERVLSWLDSGGAAPTP